MVDVPVMMLMCKNMGHGISIKSAHQKELIDDLRESKRMEILDKKKEIHNESMDKSLVVLILCGADKL